MPIHQQSKIVGQHIGKFCAEIDNKDLLFKLRNVKNFKQLVSFFKDLEFEALRHEGAAKFTKEFDEALEAILTNENDWELARDFIAIYAIDKYRSVDYAKNHDKGE